MDDRAPMCDANNRPRQVGQASSPELAAPAKVSLHAPDQALQHLAHFAGSKMAEPFPGELTAEVPFG